MMIHILSVAARRRRARGRLFLTAFAAGAGFCGGAWAASDSWRDLSLSRADGLVRQATRGMADGLYALAGDGITLSGGPPPPTLRIQLTEAWAAPGSRLPLPPEALTGTVL